MIRWVRSRPDVILLDLSLPDADGAPLMRSLRARRPTVRIVVLTMRGDADTVRQAFLEGASATWSRAPIPAT